MTDSVGPIIGRVKITICPKDVITPIICDTALLEGETKLPYNDFISAAGGTLPFAFSVLGNRALPPGLGLNPTGTFTGTPKPTAKTKNFTAQVTDNASQSTSKQLNLTMVKSVGITGRLARAKVGTNYSSSLQAKDGLAPIVWTATGLPAGLSIDASTGEVSGIPQAAGKSPVNFEATDALKGKASKSVNLVVGK